MVFKFCVADFKKINLKGINSFCKKYKANVQMSVKMDSKGIGIKIFDSNRNASICTYGVSEIEKEENVKVNKDDIVEKTFLKCDHSFYVEVKSADELRLVYLFAMYLASLGEMILINSATHQTYLYKDLKKVDCEKLEMWVGQYEISEKYNHDRFRYRKILSKVFAPTALFWILLISGSLVATVLFILMLFMFDVKNGLILGSPFMLVGIGVVGWITYNYCVYRIVGKKLSKVNFAYQYEIAQLHGDRTPKRPSGRVYSVKQIVINVLGFLILPTLILGSLLMIMGFIIGGIIVIGLPWILLIFIKKHVTDAKNEILEGDFYEWLDICSEVKLPKGIKAISIEVIDKGNKEWEVEMLGCLDFEFGTTKWTKYNVVELSKKRLKFKYNACWEDVESLLCEYLCKYLNYNRKGEFYSLFKGIAFGFNDGLIIAVYEKHLKEEERC